MKASMIRVILLLFLYTVPAGAFDLATEISVHDGKVVCSSMGYAKLNLIKLKAGSKGLVHLNGTLSIHGEANVVMWSKVDGRYYFSKLPQLQNIRDRKGVHFSIPFNAADKTITEVVLEVELMQGGKITVGDIALVNP